MRDRRCVGAGIHVKGQRQIGADCAAQFGQRLLHAQCGGLLGALCVEQFGIATDQLVARGLAGFHPHGDTTADLFDQGHVFACVALLGFTADHVVEAQFELGIHVTRLRSCVGP